MVMPCARCSPGCACHDDLSAVSELQERHPYHPLPVWNTEIPASLVVTSSSVLEALRGFPKVSSPGGSKLRCQHLLDVIEGSTTPSAQDCLANLTDLVCFLLSGQAHPYIAPWLTSAPLTALYKKQGGIRPIAVGEVVRRLTSRLCCSAVRQNCPDVFLRTGQIGVGIHGGLEAAVHSLSTVLDSQGSNPDLCCLKIDFSNAFNECNRSSFLDQVHKDFPEIFAWTQWCYHCEGELRFGDVSIKSASGVQQGDPLGLDDGTFVGSRSSVARLLNQLSSIGPSHGLHLNMSKCEVF